MPPKSHLLQGIPLLLKSRRSNCTDIVQAVQGVSERPTCTFYPQPPIRRDTIFPCNSTIMKTLLFHFFPSLARRNRHDRMLCFYLSQINRTKRVVKKEGSGWRWV
jgi:hypothetical protein